MSISRHDNNVVGFADWAMSLCGRVGRKLVFPSLHVSRRPRLPLQRRTAVSPPIVCHPPGGDMIRWREWREAGISGRGGAITAKRSTRILYGFWLCLFNSSYLLVWCIGDTGSRVRWHRSRLMLSVRITMSTARYQMPMRPPVRLAYQLIAD